MVNSCDSGYELSETYKNSQDKKDKCRENYQTKRLERIKITR